MLSKVVYRPSRKRGAVTAEGQFNWNGNSLSLSFSLGRSAGDDSSKWVLDGTTDPFLHQGWETRHLGCPGENWLLIQLWKKKDSFLFLFFFICRKGSILILKTMRIKKKGGFRQRKYMGKGRIVVFFLSSSSVALSICLPRIPRLSRVYSFNSRQYRSSVVAAIRNSSVASTVPYHLDKVSGIEDWKKKRNPCADVRALLAPFTRQNGPGISKV